LGWVLAGQRNEELLGFFSTWFGANDFFGETRSFPRKLNMVVW